MEQKKQPLFEFLSEDEKGTKKILHSQLIDFLEIQGFNNSLLEGQQELIRTSDKIIRKTSIREVKNFLRTTFENNDLREYYDVFAENPGRYVSASKLHLLKMAEVVNDRDPRDSSRFYFQNCFCEITNELIQIKKYKDLEGNIWEDRILKKDFNLPTDGKIGQFNQWCINITGNNPDRLKALKSFLGFLMHRNKERGENKAIILYDERMGAGGKANGRVGKTVLGQALAQCRKVAENDAKNKNFKSDFANELITFNTDFVFYDDLPKNVNFERFYSFITTGVDVNRKNKPIFRIEGWRSPKLLVSSNYYVSGDGGDSDMARRYEFEICNYYSKNFTPEMDFGVRFWDTRWPECEWNKFYLFMMECVQIYLANGLIEVAPINLSSKKIEDPTCPEFREFAEVYFSVGERLDKRELELNFQFMYPRWKDVTPHIFHKWCVIYAENMGLIYKPWSSGGNYFCEFTKKVEEVKDGE